VCAAGSLLRGLLAALTEEHEEEDTYQRGHDHQHRQTNTLPHPPLLYNNKENMVKRLKIQ